RDVVRALDVEPEPDPHEHGQDRAHDRVQTRRYAALARELVEPLAVYFPCQTGARFCANATAPSRASCEVATGPTISPWRSQYSASGQSTDSISTRLVAVSASGPLPAIAAASSSA